MARGEVRGARTVGHTVRTFGDSSSSQILVAPQAPPVPSTTTVAVEQGDSVGATGEEVVHHGKGEERTGTAGALQQQVCAVSCALL